MEDDLVSLVAQTRITLNRRLLNYYTPCENRGASKSIEKRLNQYSPVLMKTVVDLQIGPKSMCINCN